MMIIIIIVVPMETTRAREQKSQGGYSGETAPICLRRLSVRVCVCVCVCVFARTHCPHFILQHTAGSGEIVMFIHGICCNWAQQGDNYQLLAIRESL
jgi:hypothetical protein